MRCFPGHGARRAACGCALALIVGAAGAQTAPDTAAAAAAGPPASGRDVTQLEAVHVTADVETPAEGYVARRSVSGTKTDTPVLEIPQSISTVTREQIETQKIRSLEQAFAYTAGLVTNEGNADLTGDSLTIRGFEAFNSYGAYFRDGMRIGVNVFDGKQEPYGLECIDFLKGASAVLYGDAEPGGVINMVSKKAGGAPFGEVNVEYGSYARRQISVDAGDALDEAGRWSYRLTALARDSDTFIHYVPDDRVYFGPALHWQPDERTSWDLQGYYQRSKTMYVYALPPEVVGLGQDPNPNGEVSRHLFTGEPDYDNVVNEQKDISSLFEHAFSDDLKLRNSLSFSRADNVFDLIFIDGLEDDLRTIKRSGNDRDEHSWTAAADTHLEYRPARGRVEQTLLAGVDYSRQKWTTARYDRTLGPLDLYDPVYGAEEPGPRAPSPYSGVADYERAGVYLQDQIKLDEHWVVLLGGRESWIESKNTYPAAPSFSTDESDHAFSGRAGFVYLADHGIAPYLSFSQSFELQSGLSRSGQRFEPTVGEQYEAGIRWQPPSGKTSLSLAVYNLTKTNVLTPDPVDSEYSVQTGEIRSRGVEIEARGEIARDLNVIGSYAYTDARITRSNTPEEIGRRSGGVPYNTLSLWLDWRPLWMRALQLGVGWRYVDDTVARYLPLTTPSYTVLDAMIGYDLEHWRFAVNATNLTDKTYIANCTYGCFYGDAAKVIGTVSYRW
ncbi:TonB-dependent siderophore receptor [Solimonas soli]|uniref:TonB-dependent siderophore receptor n=1 Tax=Solimonas soli TaxID=413479 RepID=UPI0004B40361|nr:TonB-dependent siderophore receptor [Solimonas soli]